MFVGNFTRLQRHLPGRPHMHSRLHTLKRNPPPAFLPFTQNRAHSHMRKHTHTHTHMHIRTHLRWREDSDSICLRTAETGRSYTNERGPAERRRGVTPAGRSSSIAPVSCAREGQYRVGVE